MNGWLIAGWIIALTLACLLIEKTLWSRLQRRVARQRQGMNRASYISEFGRSGVGASVAGAPYDLLKERCVKGVLPHPDDGLLGFYFDYDEDLEDALEELFDKLGFSKLERYSPGTAPALGSVRELGIFVQQLRQ